MKKVLFLILGLLIMSSAGLCADAGADPAGAPAGTAVLLYPDFSFLYGMHVKIMGDDKIYSPGDPVIERLMTNTEKAKQYFDNWHFKYTEHSIIVYSSLALLIGDIWYFNSQLNLHRTLILPNTVNYHPDAASIIISASVFAAVIAGIFYGLQIEDESNLEFCKGINEYNLSVSGGSAGAGIIKNIKF